jgi:hypothetical protein
VYTEFRFNGQHVCRYFLLGTGRYAARNISVVWKKRPKSRFGAQLFLPGLQALLPEFGDGFAHFIVAVYAGMPEALGHHKSDMLRL